MFLKPIHVAISAVIAATGEEIKSADLVVDDRGARGKTYRVMTESVRGFDVTVDTSTLHGLLREEEDQRATPFATNYNNGTVALTGKVVADLAALIEAASMTSPGDSQMFWLEVGPLRDIAAFVRALNLEREADGVYYAVVGDLGGQLLHVTCYGPKPAEQHETSHGADCDCWSCQSQ